jgi:CBS domain-containing protein
MKVSDILRVKGNTLYTSTPDEPLARAVELMAEKDIGSLVVMEHGDLVGMLTFREIIQVLAESKTAAWATAPCARPWTTTP